jgi:hypothetical protein
MRPTSLWRFAATRYLPWLAGLNLVWELVQLPLYTIAYEGSPGTIAYAVLHCTAGDVLIGATAFAVAVLLARAVAPEARGAGRVLALAVFFGVGYTVFSEWLNVEVRGAWSYAPAMPRLPVLGTGLAPLLQWLVVPGVAWFAAKRGANADLVRIQ